MLSQQATNSDECKCGVVNVNVKCAHYNLTQKKTNAVAEQEIKVEG